MVARNGINRIGFVTLTFRENLTDFKEAQRRFNSLRTHVLADLCLEFITAVERQGRGAIHYHLCAAFADDIRTGFNFDACWAASDERATNGQTPLFYSYQQAYFASASPSLRAIWKLFRDKAPEYGFGRCETLPVKSNTQAVARYVGSYVGREAAKREKRDKGMRSLRYSLGRTEFLDSNGNQSSFSNRKVSARFSWVDGAGRFWRLGCAVFAQVLGHSDFEAALGKRWAWSTKEIIGELGRHFDRACELLPEYLARSEGGFARDRFQSACLLALRLRMEAKDV